MSAENARLLRRPLPPKKVPPLIKSFPHHMLSDPVVESIPSIRRALGSTTPRSDSSCQVPMFWDHDRPIFRVAPTPQLTAIPSILLPKMIEGFPCRPPRTLPKISVVDLLQTDPRYIPSPPSFCFNDFLRRENGGGVAQSLEGLKKVALSRCNYQKQMGLFLMELHRRPQTKVCTQLMSCEVLPEAKNRIPHRQIICGA